ncbi:spore maturation protein B [Clostridium sp. CAG:1219]|nr:spore maturation protein B [Clostridium sp. CAG:1219]
MIDYITMSTVPVMILLIIIIGVKEKKDVFALFIDGVKEGLKVVLGIFPYILAILIAIGLFRNSGALDLIIKPITPVLNTLGVPKEIIPLCILRPLSGGASMSLVMDIFKNYGVDSISGKIASIIMGGTETTIYCITILFGAVKIKKLRGVLIAGLIADFVVISTAIIIVKLGFI